MLFYCKLKLKKKINYILKGFFNKLYNMANSDAISIKKM